MDTNTASSLPHAASEPDGGPAGRSAVGRLFAAALDGDRRAEAVLHLLGGFDHTAHRASFALLSIGPDDRGPTPPDVLASIDRALAALRDHQRRTA
jgi:hypothetical protein